MAWTWLTNVTDDTYWEASCEGWDDILSWTGSSWATAGSGLYDALLSPKEAYYDEYYGYDDPSPLYGETIRAIKVYWSLTDPPITYDASIEILTTEGQTTTPEVLSTLTGVYETSWVAAPSEGVANIVFKQFGSWYEPGLITRIDVEVYTADPPEDPEPVAVWTGYRNCREIVV